MYYQQPNFWQQIELRIQALEQENQQLKEAVQQIKPIHIENINYKIQELSVKELKGTLNIGLTSLKDPEEVKKWLQESEDGAEVQLEDIEQGGGQVYPQNPSNPHHPSNSLNHSNPHNQYNSPNHSNPPNHFHITSD